jgi:hypothetical protein
MVRGGLGRNLRDRATSPPHTPSLRGALATKQSRLRPRKDSGLLRFARNDGERAGGLAVGWAKAHSAVPTTCIDIARLVGTLRFAHPTRSAVLSLHRAGGDGGGLDHGAGEASGETCVIARRCLHTLRHCEEPLRRSNPERFRGKTLDCFASLAMTGRERGLTRRVGKGAQRRAHHLYRYREIGGHASLCPPYEITLRVASRGPLHPAAW